MPSRHQSPVGRVPLGVLAFLLAAPGLARALDDPQKPPETSLFARENLIAWCIVPFDSKNRGPEERAAMLARLGFRHFAYDWRAEHIPTFDAEIEALKRHGVALDAFWVAPGVLNRESQLILDTLKRHGVRAQLWALLDLGPDKVEGEEQARRVAKAVEQLGPLAEEAAKIGCTVGLYNHGGWFGEPENQIAIIERLNAQGIKNVGMVYNLHHGHAHLDRFAALLATMKPYLFALNLNGMDPGGDQAGRKILPLGQGSRDLALLRIIQDSGYRGPIGILGHTQDDAEQRLLDNLDGLDWLVPQLDGRPAGPRPTPRTPVPPPPAQPPQEAASNLLPFDETRITELLTQARTLGDARRGAEVFTSSKFACLSCHKVGEQGGAIGPELTTAGVCIPPEALVEAVLWPKRQVKSGYEALTIATRDGRRLQGYKLEESATELALRDVANGERVAISLEDIEERREDGTLMPDGLASAMTTAERADLIRFLTDLGRSPDATAWLRSTHTPASFPYDRLPIHPELWPSHNLPVNRDRLYDFYAKEAAFFRLQPTGPALLPQFPGLDGGKLGHWGNQNEEVWADDRWNQTDLGRLISGTFRGAGVTVAKGVCVRIGDLGELAVCFNPETLCYEALWYGGFVKFSSKRHGFLGGLILDGAPLPRPNGAKPDRPFVYHGFYRHGDRVIFSYKIGDEEMLDSPWVDADGRFTRIVGPAAEHPLADLTRGGPSSWPQEIVTRGRPGASRPYAIDTIELPFDNPWKALVFCGDHDFEPDGTGFVSTMQGDVWRVQGLDASLERVRWRRVASGLYHALGLVVADGTAYVLGRDQITRLHDLNGDGEADFYECVSNAYQTSTGGHDFISGLQRDPEGRFYTASSNQGLLRISRDGQAVEVLATGLRNPDGLGLAPDGALTVPSSEGDWVPASMLCEVRPQRGGHFGAKGPRGDQAPTLPLVYLPRGLDNSSGGQVAITSERWGPLQGQMLHFSYGMGGHFLLLRDEVDQQPQGAVVPLAGEFRAGAHRGRFNPHDGQLYVSGMGGWGTYTPDDGSFQRVRYTGDIVRLPVAFHAHQNGVMVRFSAPIDREKAGQAQSQFAQAWNYRYGPGYGSPEFATRHPGVAGHDRLEIHSVHVLDDGLTLFLELPELQPVNQLHLSLIVGEGDPIDLFATIHKLAEPFTGFTGYQPSTKTIAAHPILADMAALKHKPAPNPHQKPITGARTVRIETGSNLNFLTKSLRARAGEPIKLTLSNPDVVPHNWALIRPGTLARVGDLANRLIAEPDAAARQYIPRADDVLAYTNIVPPGESFTIHFLAPAEPGRYPYLCTFPGHWMVMNGELIVEP